MEFLQLLLLLLSQIFSVGHGFHEAERIALLQFKSLLTDPSGRLASWKGQNCCDWHGIRCSSKSFHVVSVDLRNSKPESFMRSINSELIITSSESIAINGTIAPSLFTLSHLRYLDLSFNNFQFSEIPSQMANLKHLSYLNLSNSKFSGSITTQFANLSSLQYLDLSSSFLILDYSSVSYNYSSSKGSMSYPASYFPSSYIYSKDLSWLRGLVNLRVLRLCGVDLSMESSSMNWAEPMSFLSDLTELRLSDCGISSPIPTYEFFNLSSLYSLVMDFNFLNSPIPVQLANFTSLSILDLTSCNLQGSLAYLPQLQQLYIDKNPDLFIDFPWMFALPWSNLRTLSMSSTNVIGTIPSSISNASQLVYIDGSNCGIQGSIQTSISNLSSLQTLNLNSNNITGYLPSTISKLKNLQNLLLFQNNLKGSFPESICEISSLRQLHLGSNHFSGRIPSCISKLQNLQMFYITKNSMEGTVSLASLFPKSNPILIGLGMNRLTVEAFRYPFPSYFQPENLMLQSCNLNGSIPTFICNLTQLSFLHLSANSLTGTIPSCLFELPNLSYLDLSHNNFHGTVPHSLHLNINFPISMLSLANNSFQGPLPLPPGNVEILDLSQNKFTGGIPSEFGDRLSKARYVSLSENELSGPIPVSICSVGYVLMNLDLSSNQLSGSIHSSLEHCTSLIYLNLGRNHLTGNVPNQLQRVKNLEVVQFNDNNLDGPFPNFIQKLKDLQVLNLGKNNFQGSVPAFIGNLQNLQILVLSWNSFNGSIPEEITHLHKLQFLDLSSNKLSGHIPDKISGLQMLTSQPKSTILLGYEISLMYIEVELQMVTKGIVQQLDLVFNYNSGIDFSCNNFSGKIPQEIGLLRGLYMLNLSHNCLSGLIPFSLGDMVGLESLDLSFNKLNGEIPQSLTWVDFLTTLNLSYNNLSGRIPRGMHFDTLSLDGSAYIGNDLLCGFPTRKSCDGGSTTNVDDKEVEDKEHGREKWLFYGVVALGYAVGLWGLFFVLELKQKWWSEYWRCVDSFAWAVVRCLSKE